MTIQEIITAVNNGNTVYWHNELYEVRTEVRYSTDPRDFYVYCLENGSIHGIVNRETGEPLDTLEDYMISARYNRRTIEEGDMVSYTHIHGDGITSTTVQTMVESISQGNYPFVTLFNGHRAQWDGTEFRMDGIDAVLRSWEQ